MQLRQCRPINYYVWVLRGFDVTIGPWLKVAVIDALPVAWPSVDGGRLALRLSARPFARANRFHLQIVQICLISVPFFTL